MQFFSIFAPGKSLNANNLRRNTLLYIAFRIKTLRQKIAVITFESRLNKVAAKCKLLAKRKRNVKCSNASQFLFLFHVE